MASTTGVPERNPAVTTTGTGEDEPLLGRAGDASQQDGRPLQYNFVLGTAVIAQVGIWIMTINVWVAVLIKPKAFSIFTPHPLLNTAGLLLTVQAILVLQPTHTAKQKHNGTTVHAILNGISVIALLIAFIVIEYNKFAHGAPHFTSVHGRLGLVTYIAWYLQALVGLAQYYIPQLFGGVTNAKKIYKYHRVGGYIVTTLGLATVCAATQTGFNESTFHLKLWAMLVTSILVLVGILPRIKKQKLGL